MKLLKILYFGLFLFCLSGCSSDKLDGSIVIINDQYYELQHRLSDTYLLHKLSSDEIEKIKTNAKTLKEH